MMADAVLSFAAGSLNILFGYHLEEVNRLGIRRDGQLAQQV